MNIYKNARLKPIRREEMAGLVVDAQLSKTQADHRFGVSSKTISH